MVAASTPVAAPADAKIRDSRAANNLLLAAALGLTVVRLAIASYTGLVDDEAYYRIWSLAPSLSYLDHPPMVAWIIGAGRALAGDGTLGVRLLAPLIVLAGAAVLWRTALLLYGPDIARCAVWIMLAMPLLAVGGIIVTPDLPSVLFAGLVVWGIAELDRGRNAKWWLAIGLFAGLGLLSKYTNLFLGGTILLWLLATPENRKWFRAPELWIGGIIAALVASPVVIWNAEHDWASFTKQFGRVAHGGSAGLSYLIELIGGFALLESPLIATLALVGFIGVIRAAISQRRQSDVLLAAAIVPMLLYFCIHALHDRVQGNWPGPLYPFFAICAALGLTVVPMAWRRAAFVGALALGFATTALVYIHALHPLFQSAKDPTEQMRGWPALSDAIEKTREETGAAWLATSSYATTGQLMMGIKGRSEVAQLDERIRYIFLPPLPDALLSKPALYVELERRVDLPLLRKKFANISKVATLTRNNGSTSGATYVLYLVSAPLQPPLAMDDKR
ncbi:glycosyltransferase family 39 protein [Hyphomicrobium sp.]|jgi:4-amino-4-deoxy-L-arabinose transferase-like glycosyltransferase|uniref:glycosyltransferase family 39 protein n=1 Tax=Hyphomicrobium sp. TaxID=82 RepID=UPI00356B5BD1